MTDDRYTILKNMHDDHIDNQKNICSTTTLPYYAFKHMYIVRDYLNCDDHYKYLYVSLSKCTGFIITDTFVYKKHKRSKKWTMILKSSKKQLKMHYSDKPSILQQL